MTANNQPRLYALPTEVGARRTHPLAVLAFVVALALATQYVAALLHDNPSLGRPLARVTIAGHVGAMYAPWAWAWWAWIFSNPVTGGGYPAEVYRALRSLIYTMGGGFAAALVAMIVVDAALGARRRKVDEMTDSAHWATEQEVEREGLLSARAEPNIGGGVAGSASPHALDSGVSANLHACGMNMGRPE